MGEVTGVSAEVEINSYLQNLLSDYPDLPLVSPGATNPFWLAAENLLPHPRSDIHGISTSESMSNKHIEELPAPERTGESVRSRLAEQTDERVPPSYRDPSVVAGYTHTAALKIIESLEEQLPISRVPIDQAMRLNRQAMAKVREVSNTDEFRRCQRCPLLVATVLDLVVGLYELVLLSIQRPASEGDTVSLADQNNLPWPQSPFQQRARTGEMPRGGGSSPGSAISDGSEPPLFQFGRLEFDPDEQEIFRTAMVICDGALKP